MAGALVFGLINHFIIDGSDHVAHVAAAWRTQFSVTAALLVVLEAAGVAIGIWSRSESVVGEQGRRKRSDLHLGEEGLTLNRQEKTS